MHFYPIIQGDEREREGEGEAQRAPYDPYRRRRLQRRFGAVRKSLSYERSLSKWERGANEGTSARARPSGLPLRPVAANDANMRDSPSLPASQKTGQD